MQNKSDAKNNARKNHATVIMRDPENLVENLLLYF